MKMTFRNKKHGFALVVFLTLAAAAGVMIGYQYSTSAQTEVLTTKSPEIQAAMSRRPYCLIKKSIRNESLPHQEIYSKCF